MPQYIVLVAQLKSDQEIQRTFRYSGLDLSIDDYDPWMLLIATQYTLECRPAHVYHYPTVGNVRKSVIRKHWVS